MYDEKFVHKIGRILLRKQETIATAESVTAGHLQASFSLAENAREFFQGGITAYNLGQKARHLHIDPIQGEACNCVSSRVAEQMATGACNLFSADWGISVTGYAAKVPELDVDTLFAYVAVAYHNDVVYVKKIKAPELSSMEVQLHYVNSVVKILVKLLK
jgi:nicotinamide-nucleotide amidase